MSIYRLTWVFLIALIFLPAYSCTDTDVEQKPAVFKQVPEMQDIKPQKPVKIKLKRNVKGRYYWDITGYNEEEIIKADKRLREVYEESKEK